MKSITSILCIFSFVLFFTNCKEAAPPPKDKDEPQVDIPQGAKEHTDSLISKIAFGSCSRQDYPLPVLGLAASQKPDVFVFLGDNIYGDTKIMDTLIAKYNRLGSKFHYKELREVTEVLATWDDHDYGWNDSGRHYPFKEASKNIFLDFWKAPENDVRRSREGIYTSYFYEYGGKVVQIILLDTRTFRDDLRRYEDYPKVEMKEMHYYRDYSPYETTDSTLLGETQWKWLAGQFMIPADVRIVASSTQFGISWNGYEAWANFPHEQQKFLNLIRQTRANGVIFISGDVHYAEISKIESDNLYPIYDVTSSGITATWSFATSNENRVDGPVRENNFGLIEIDWSVADPEISMQIIDKTDSLRIKRKVKLSELKLK